MLVLKHYPVSLKLEQKQVVIVGGGVIAERKLEKLLATGAVITVISPEITERIHQLVMNGVVLWKEKLFFHDDVKEAFLIIAATNCQEVNQQVADACDSHQLLTVVDDPKRSNFIVPATISRGKLDISVSTGGASPSLAKKIAEQLVYELDEAYEEYIDFLDHCRKKVLDTIPEAAVRKKVLKQLLEPVFLEFTRNQYYKERELLFLKLLHNGGEFRD